jgi:hypothetical protein
MTVHAAPSIADTIRNNYITYTLLSQVIYTYILEECVMKRYDSISEWPPPAGRTNFLNSSERRFCRKGTFDKMRIRFYEGQYITAGQTERERRQDGNGVRSRQRSPSHKLRTHEGSILNAKNVSQYILTLEALSSSNLLTCRSHLLLSIRR